MYQKCKTRTAVILLIISLSTSAKALDIPGYLIYKAASQESVERLALLSHLMGASDAYAYTNATLLISGRPQIFCAPERMALNYDNLIYLIDTELSRGREAYIKVETSIAYVLLRALQQSFPCSENKKK